MSVSEPYRGTDPWKRQFYALFFAESLAIMGFGISIPTIPFLLKDMGVLEGPSLNWWNGLCQTLPMLSMAILGPVWGTLADKSGKRLMLLRAMIGGAITVGLMALAWSPLVLVSFRTVQGALTGTVAAANVLVASFVPKAEMGFAMGMLQMGIFTGNALGPLLGGIVADVFGRRVTFFVSAFLLAASAALILAYVKNDRNKRMSLADSELQESSEGLAVKKGTRFVSGISELVQSSPGVWTVIALGFLFQMGTSIANPILPLLVLHLSPDASYVASISGTILGVSSLGAALSSVVIGRRAAKIGYAKVLALCFVGAGLFCIPQGLVGSPWLVLVFRTLSSICIGGLLSTVPSLIAERAHENRQGVIYGINTTVGAFGMAIGPMLGSAFASYWGFPSVFLAASAVLCSTGLVISVRRRGRA